MKKLINVILFVLEIPINLYLNALSNEIDVNDLTTYWVLFTHPVFWIGIIICIIINNFGLDSLKKPIKSDNNDGSNHNNQVNQEMQKKPQIIDILRYVLFIIVILLFVSFAFTTVIPKGAAKTDEDNQKTVVSEEKDNNTENEESENEKVVIKEEKPM